MPSVTMTLEELDGLRARERAAIMRTVELEKQLVEAKQADPLERIGQLMLLCRTFMGITRFAIANLPPETIKGWPWLNLEMLVENLKHLPDFSMDDESFVSDLRAFARECKDHEERRARGVKLDGVVATFEG